MSNLLNLATMAPNEFEVYKKIVNYYNGSNELDTFCEKNVTYLKMTEYINVWFDRNTLLIHHPDEPAVVRNNNDKSYFYFNQGKLHKTDGFALKHMGGCYAIDNKMYYSLQEYNKALKKYNEEMYLKEHPELQAFI